MSQLSTIGTWNEPFMKEWLNQIPVKVEDESIDKDNHEIGITDGAAGGGAAAAEADVDSEMEVALCEMLEKPKVVFMKLSEELKGNVMLIEEALKDGLSLRSLTEEQKADERIVRIALVINYEEFEYISVSLKNNSNFVIEMLELNIKVYDMIDESNITKKIKEKRDNLLLDLPLNVKTLDESGLPDGNQEGQAFHSDIL